MKIQVFWDTTPCRLVESCQLFRGACRLLESGYIQYNILQRASNHLPVDIASYSRTVGSSLTPLPEPESSE
jgi:hypothetical protein